MTSDSGPEASNSRPLLAVVDYGMGNLLSIEKALEAAGARVKRVDSGEGWEDAAGLVLPGVGNFGKASENLMARGLMTPLRQALREGRPFLGVCLGFQLLFEGSEEAPKRQGLGFLSGQVVRFRNAPRVPHMGWSPVTRDDGGTGRPGEGERGRGGEGGKSPEPYYYFVHSYYPAPRPGALKGDCLWADYGGKFLAGYREKRLSAYQFHPEKSGPDGQILLRQFLAGLKGA